MATWYYLTKYMKKRNCTNTNTIHDYYNELTENVIKTNDELISKCRVCLQKGTIEIFDCEISSDIIEALQIFGDIQVNNHDEYPKLLCNNCFSFTKAAILFRKVAKRSEETLKQPLKEESLLDTEQDSNHSYGDNNEDFESKPPITLEIEPKLENIKKEKKEKKKADKVTCHVCNKVMNRSYYNQHITMHDPDHKKYVCDICGMSFRLRCAYHNHSLRHRTDFPYKCTFCPYRGRYAELLKTHLRTHTGDYRYMCTECPARFHFKSNLNSHMLRKHKEPQFKCDTCKRAYHTTLALQRHFEADHLGIKSHVCNICGKAFGYRNAMMKHQRLVHKREKLLFGRMPSYLEAENKNTQKFSI